jgi:hypothetical protein
MKYNHIVCIIRKNFLLYLVDRWNHRIEGTVIARSLYSTVTALLIIDKWITHWQLAGSQYLDESGVVISSLPMRALIYNQGIRLITW